VGPRAVLETVAKTKIPSQSTGPHFTYDVTPSQLTFSQSTLVRLYLV